MNSPDFSYQSRSFWQSRSLYDYVWLLLLVLGGAYVLAQYQSLMDGYEVAILSLTVSGLVWMGWQWNALKQLLLTVTVFSLLAVQSYGAELARGERPWPEVSATCMVGNDAHP